MVRGGVLDSCLTQSQSMNPEHALCHHTLPWVTLVLQKVM